MTVRRWIATAAVAAGAVAAASFAGRPVRRHLFQPSPQVAAEAVLQSRIPEIDFDGLRLGLCVEALAEYTGAKIELDAPALAPLDVDEQNRVDLRLRNVTLEQVLSALAGYLSDGGRVVYTIHEGRIVLTNADNLGPYAYARVYDVRDLKSGDPWPDAGGRVDDGLMGKGNCFPPRVRAEVDDEILAILQQCVSPETWVDAGGTGGSVHALNGRVLVVADWHTHLQIQSLLDALRSPVRPGQ